MVSEMISHSTMTRKQSKSTQKASPKTKTCARAKKPIPQREGSGTEFIDQLILKGIAGDNLLAKVKAEKRGPIQFATMGQIKAHAKAAPCRGRPLSLPPLTGHLKRAYREISASARAL